MISIVNTITTPSEILRSLEQVLEQQGVQAGVELLNARVAHRYTCVFELQGNILTSRFVCDKLKQVTPDALKSIKLKDSFCQFVLRDGIFATFSSSNDERVEDVKATEAFDAYVGVPLQDGPGKLFGTLCHIDHSALDLSAEEFSIFEQAGSLLPRFIWPVARLRD